VVTFCERPLQIANGSDKHLIDFWVRYREREALLVLGEEGPPSEVMLGDASLRVHAVPPAEVAAARVWISNWEQMLPCLIACQQFIGRSFADSIVKFVWTPT